MNISKAFAKAVRAEIERKQALLFRNEQMLELAGRRVKVAQADLDAVVSDLAELDDFLASTQEGRYLYVGPNPATH